MPLRAASGQDNGVTSLDINGDGYMDVVVANERVTETWLWNPRRQLWTTNRFPVPLVSLDEFGQHRLMGARFGSFETARSACSSRQKKPDMLDLSWDGMDSL